MSCDKDKCVICSEKLIDGTNRPNDADIDLTERKPKTLTLSRGLCLPTLMDLGDFTLTVKGQTCDTISEFSSVSTIYCSDCFTVIRDLEVIFMQIGELEQKWNERKLQIEEILKKSLKLGQDGQEKDNINQNQKLRKEVIARLEILKQSKREQSQSMARTVSVSKSTQTFRFRYGKNKRKLILSNRRNQSKPELHNLTLFSNKDEIDQFIDKVPLEDLFHPENTKAVLNVNETNFFEDGHGKSETTDSSSPTHSLTSVDSLKEKSYREYSSTTIISEYPNLDKNEMDLDCFDANSITLNIAKAQTMITNQITSARSIGIHHKKSGLDLHADSGQNLNELNENANSDDGSVTKRLKKCSSRILEAEGDRPLLKRGMRDCFICEICNDSFHLLKDFRHHTFTHKPPHSCRHCDKICTSDDHLKLHIAETHCDKEQRFLCEICSLSFSEPEYLNYHHSKHHWDEPIVEKPRKSKSLTCSECGLMFGCQSNLSNHIKLVHKKEFRLQCEFCGYGCLNNSSLQRHMVQKHSDARDYECDECGTSFKTQNKLTVHKRMHTGERPYVCKVCSKAFTVNDRLKRHELIHTNEQCHTCPLCDKTFPVKDYLKLHMLQTHYKLKKAQQKQNEETNLVADRY